MRIYIFIYIYINVVYIHREKWWQFELIFIYFVVSSHENFTLYHIKIFVTFCDYNIFTFNVLKVIMFYECLDIKVTLSRIINKYKINSDVYY